MFAGEVISQAVTRHFGGPVESGKCFGIPGHHLKLNGLTVCRLPFQLCFSFSIIITCLIFMKQVQLKKSRLALTEECKREACPI